eukprot:scaffold395_cov243-Pinguiococcus_pyrenoidosus.AAC.10
MGTRATVALLLSVGAPRDHFSTPPRLWQRTPKADADTTPAALVSRATMLDELKERAEVSEDQSQTEARNAKEKSPQISVRRQRRSLDARKELQIRQQVRRQGAVVASEA